MDKAPNIVRRHVPMAEQVLDTRVDSHDGVENAGLRIGVELDQDR
jgi:hypothetical protein